MVSIQEVDVAWISSKETTKIIGAGWFDLLTDDGSTKRLFAIARKYKDREKLNPKLLVLPREKGIIDRLHTHLLEKYNTIPEVKKSKVQPKQDKLQDEMEKLKKENLDLMKQIGALNKSKTTKKDKK